MKTGLARFLLVIVTAAMVGAAFASKPVFNEAYVQSGPGGIFYARCIPDGPKGPEGVTEIYRVRKDGDELLDRYDWYADGGVVLSWSPIAGKVGVLAIHGTIMMPRDPGHVELAMYLGGKLLRKWTTAELQKFEPKDVQLPVGRVVGSSVGCEQVANTNEYVYVVNIGGKRVLFDILTGEPYGK